MMDGDKHGNNYNGLDLPIVLVKTQAQIRASETQTSSGLNRRVHFSFV